MVRARNLPTLSDCCRHLGWSSKLDYSQYRAKLLISSGSTIWFGQELAIYTYIPPVAAHLRQASTAMAPRKRHYHDSISIWCASTITMCDHARKSVSPRAPQLKRICARWGHPSVEVPKRCEGFMVIWLRAREEFANNQFQLLFMYI